jgi:antitoxin ParD1/3/4
VSEVVRAGLRRLEEHEQKEGALRRALEQGAASGDAGPLDFSELRRKARAQAGLAPEDE